VQSSPTHSSLESPRSATVALGTQCGIMARAQCKPPQKKKAGAPAVKERLSCISHRGYFGGISPISPSSWTENQEFLVFIHAKNKRVFCFKRGKLQRTEYVILNYALALIQKNEPKVDLFVCPPEGGACSSWIKHGFSHSLRQRLRGVTGKWFGRVG
jgi:hypothetical protein